MLILGCRGWEENYIICCSENREKLEIELNSLEEKVKKFELVSDVYHEMYSNIINSDELSDEQFNQALNDFHKKFCETYEFDLSELDNIIYFSTLNEFYISEIKEI